MSSIIQFPNDKKTRLEITTKRKKQKVPLPQQPQQQIPVVKVYIHDLPEIIEHIKSLSDTMKYVTDGLYAITLELKETKDCLVYSNERKKRIIKYAIVGLLIWLVFH